MTETRERILSCACELYLEDGFDGFSMRKLARQVGVTAPALYRHFEGKEDLLLEIVMEGYRTQVQYLYEALGGETPAERFRRAGKAYVRFALEHPRYYEILYAWGQILGLDDPPEEIAGLLRAIQQFWMDRVRECMDAGVLRPGDPEIVARTFWALTHGMISIHQKGMLCVTDEDFPGTYLASIRHLMEGVGGGAWEAEGATGRDDAEPRMERPGSGGSR